MLFKCPKMALLNGLLKEACLQCARMISKRLSKRPVMSQPVDIWNLPLTTPRLARPTISTQAAKSQFWSYPPKKSISFGNQTWPS